MTMTTETTTPETTTEETTPAPLTVETVLGELVQAAFGTDETITPYKIATVINGVFRIMGAEKRIPTQMMYNYDRNGLIVKGKKGAKAYTRDEVTAYVTKYTNKHLG